MVPYRLTPTSVNVLLGGKSHTITQDSHFNYSKIREAIKAGEFDSLEELFDVSKAVETFSEGLVSVVAGEVLYEGQPVHNSLTHRMLEQMREGFNIRPMAAFLSNLMLNPSKRAVDELYTFLEACGLPITEDGHFVAYKKIRDNYTDIYTGRINNALGQIVSMRRNLVDEDKSRTCSAGLHFCSMDYLPHYGGSGAGYRVILVKINPADVVAIPADYNNTKGRTCRYEVIGEVPIDDLDLGEHSVVFTSTGDFILDEDDDGSQEFSVYYQNEAYGADHLHESDIDNKREAIESATALLDDSTVHSVQVVNDVTGDVVFHEVNLAWVDRMDDEPLTTTVTSTPPAYVLEQRTSVDGEYQFKSQDFDLEFLKDSVKAGVDSNVYSSRIVRCTDGSIMCELRNPAYVNPVAPVASAPAAAWPYPPTKPARPAHELSPILVDAVADTTIPELRTDLFSKTQIAALLTGNGSNFAAVDEAVKKGTVVAVKADGFTWYALTK